MTSPEYETTRPVKVSLDGKIFVGTYRVMMGSVIVHFGNKSKVAQYGMDRPEHVARWVLSDMCRNVEARKRTSASTEPTPVKP